MAELVLSDREIAAGVVFVKSDCYPDRAVPGQLRWYARHPSGWMTEGVGPSHEDCIRQVNERLAEAMIAAGYMPAAEGTTITREFVGTPPDERLVALGIRRDEVRRPSCP